MAHLSQVPSRRCEESVRLLGQLTVFQDKFLLMTQSHYCAISAADGECSVPFPAPPLPFHLSLLLLIPAPEFSSALSLQEAELAVEKRGPRLGCLSLHVDSQASRINQSPSEGETMGGRRAGGG